LRFRVLGPLQVLDGESPVVVPKGKVSVLLAALLLRANQVVPAGQLVDWLWGSDLPADPRRALHVYVARLRQALGGDEDVSVIATHTSGYRIEASAQTLDLLRVRELLEQAKSVQGSDPAAESAYLAEALSLWQRPILPEVPSDVLRRDEAGRLDEEWADTVERRVEVDISLGRHRELVGELTGLVVQFPLRERLRAQLMVALYRSGRQADALAEYDRLRRQLADDLGADPGAELRRLHQQILAAAPELDPPVTVPAETEPAVARPAPLRQLPADLPSFTGRVAELDRLLALPAGDRLALTVVIGAIDGMAGIGKTTLAVQAAHRLADQFTDGQLFLDLHGFTQGVPPVEPADALGRLLRALGVPGGQIPAHVDDRAALYRSKLAETRTLIVLDNAATEAQVRPLLPGAPGSLVLVTSRRRLTGLDTTDHVSLDVLPLADAVALFTHAVGANRLGAEPSSVVAEVVRQCGRLPLAIRIAAARLRSRPAWTVAHLVGRLRDHQHRLAELDAGRRSVTAALAMSYRDLTVDQRRLYQLLGSHPGTDIDTYAAAALAGITVAEANRLLDELLDIHLIAEPTPGRYRFHDLTRAHASIAGEKPGPDRRAALTRLFDYYAHTASVAMDLVYRYDAGQRPQWPRPDCPTPALHDPSQAGAWLEAELDNLLAAAAHAGTNGWPDHTLHLSATLHRHLRTRAHHGYAITLHRQAVAAARATGSRIGELTGLNSIGDIHRLQGRYEPATDHFEQALQIARLTGHRPGELAGLVGLGHVSMLQGRYEPATESYRQALEIGRTTGDGNGELDALLGLGTIHRMQGRYDEATDSYRRAWEIARTTGYRTGELTALNGLGSVSGQRGRYEQATEHYRQSLRLVREIGDRQGELSVLTGLAWIHRMQGRDEAIDLFGQVLAVAREIGDREGELTALNGLGWTIQAQGPDEPAAGYFRQCLGMAREIGDRNFEFEALQGLGRIHHAAGEQDSALACHEQALHIADELAQAADQARAHDGLAHTHRALDHHDRAQYHWKRALTILTPLGIDQTEEPKVSTAAIRAHLSGDTRVARTSRSPASVRTPTA
jgi:DNA-binding SARP family transcriptional activator/tetratricopeptide (TPR) repeat protein